MNHIFVKSNNVVKYLVFWQNYQILHFCLKLEQIFFIIPIYTSCLLKIIHDKPFIHFIMTAIVLFQNIPGPSKCDLWYLFYERHLYFSISQDFFSSSHLFCHLRIPHLFYCSMCRLICQRNLAQNITNTFAKTTQILLQKL